MKIKRLSVKIVLVISALFCFFINAEAQKIKVSEKDKIKILKILLSEINFEPENYRSDEKQILFSKTNMPLRFQRNFPKKLDGHKTRLLSKEEIYPRFAFVYYIFENFKVTKRSILVDVFRRSKNSEYGTGYKFHKIKGKWKSKVTILYGKDID